MIISWIAILEFGIELYVNNRVIDDNGESFYYLHRGAYTFYDRKENKLI